MNVEVLAKLDELLSNTGNAGQPDSNARETL